MIKAVIFDMDGLLTDSESIGLVGMRECGRLQGFEMSDALLLRSMGCTHDRCCAMYREEFPRMDTERLFQDFKIYMHALANEGKIPLMKGALRLLDALDEMSIPYAVGSSSMTDTVQLYLKKTNIYNRFKAIVAGGRVFPSKPAPDIFLEAARLMQIEPAYCLVLEDSASGLQAGRNAGMQVCMVPDMTPYSPELAPYCDWVKKDLDEVIQLVKMI